MLVTVHDFVKQNSRDNVLFKDLFYNRERLGTNYQSINGLLSLFDDKMAKKLSSFVEKKGVACSLQSFKNRSMEFKYVNKRHILKNDRIMDSKHENLNSTVMGSELVDMSLTHKSISPKK
jgi:hypothetical protein